MRRIHGELSQRVDAKEAVIAWPAGGLWTPGDHTQMADRALPTTALSEKYSAASNSDLPHNLSPPYFPQCCSRARGEGDCARQWARETPAGLYISPYRPQSAVVVMLGSHSTAVPHTQELMGSGTQRYHIVPTFRSLFSSWSRLNQPYTSFCPPKTRSYSFLLPTSTQLK